MPIRSLIIVSLMLFSALTAFAQQAEEATETARQARQLINALGCKACHKLAGDGGSLAAGLDQIGSRLTAKQISVQLVAHTESRKKGFMPSYNTTSTIELKTISDYLYNLR
ncbi:MAG: hypothetical protein IMY82_02270 [Chloroflexi bacterium]|nr:hypothetical protein [Chloroflexota bacterium]